MARSGGQYHQRGHAEILAEIDRGRQIQLNQRLWRCVFAVNRWHYEFAQLPLGNSRESRRFAYRGIARRLLPGFSRWRGRRTACRLASLPHPASVGDGM
jgi:hypothetical protein